MQPGSRIMGDDMAHPASSLFFIGLLTGLVVLLERIVRDNGPAIREALLGVPTAVSSHQVQSALEGVGSCLRASFPSRDQEILAPELGRLLRQLGGDTPARVRYA